MLDRLFAVAGIIWGVANVGVGVYVLVSWLRSGPVDPKIEERAVMWSMSWPTKNGDEPHAEPTAVNGQVTD